VTGSASPSRAGKHRAARQCHRPSAARRGLHHLPPPVLGANVVTTENSDWATNCPEYKVTAVEVTKVTQPSDWQERYRKFSEQQLDKLPQRHKETV
jgi:hypothetical protein